ncbi:MAG: biotin-dependent carboxyltransferase family protein [Bacillota bacterium]
MGSVRVVAPGLFTTVQDFGRGGYQRFGVPTAGVFDRFGASVANWLVGNPTDAAVLEITFLGPTLVADCPLQMAIAGGRVAACLDDQPLAEYQSFWWQPGQTLTLGGMQAGARAYLAVAGGWLVPAVMGSSATYVRAGIGGYRGRQLQSGDQLTVNPSPTELPGKRLPRAFWPQLSSSVRLRYVPGPQDDHFPLAELEAFQGHSYQVAPQSDRMGVRLTGPAVRPEQPDIVSDAIALGSIQIPRDGQPIVMGPDHQTTGGYPKIGTVVSGDMDSAGAAAAWRQRQLAGCLG